MGIGEDVDHCPILQVALSHADHVIHRVIVFSDVIDRDSGSGCVGRKKITEPQCLDDLSQHCIRFAAEDRIILAGWWADHPALKDPVPCTALVCDIAFFRIYLDAVDVSAVVFTVNV